MSITNDTILTYKCPAKIREITKEEYYKNGNAVPIEVNFEVAKHHDLSEAIINTKLIHNDTTTITYNQTFLYEVTEDEFDTLIKHPDHILVHVELATETINDSTKIVLKDVFFEMDIYLYGDKVNEEFDIFENFVNYVQVLEDLDKFEENLDYELVDTDSFHLSKEKLEEVFRTIQAAQIYRESTCDNLIEILNEINRLVATSGALVELGNPIRRLSWGILTAVTGLYEDIIEIKKLLILYEDRLSSTKLFQKRLKA